jgi:hypothetical protein
MNISFVEEVNGDLDVSAEVGPYSTNAEEKEHEDDQDMPLHFF